MGPESSSHQSLPSSPANVLKIMVMTTENFIASCRHQPTRPYSLTTLNAVRTQLLQDPFFDPCHRVDEIARRSKPSENIKFTDMLVLFSRLMRVLMRDQSANRLSEEELIERIDVRNACLDETFFDRGRVNPSRPFNHDQNIDEGCFV